MRCDAARRTIIEPQAGRLCVMASRHRLGCVLVARAGVEERLLRSAPSGDRPLGVAHDAEFHDWRAHLELLEDLRAEGRVVPVG